MIWLAGLLLVAVVFWMWWDIAYGFDMGQRATRAEETADRALEAAADARADVQAIIAHLQGDEGAPTGRHAR